MSKQIFTSWHDPKVSPPGINRKLIILLDDERTYVAYYDTDNDGEFMYYTTTDDEIYPSQVLLYTSFPKI